MVHRHSDKNQPSPIEAAADVLRRKWKPSILWLLSQENLRFGEIHRHLPDVSHKVLTEVLRELQADGMVERVERAGGRRHVEYALTSLGSSFVPVLQALDTWGRSYRGAG